MRISLPSNWKFDLLNRIEQEPTSRRYLHDLYGANDFGLTGTGRPFFLMPKKKKLEIEAFINKTHAMNLKFTWLWNGMCLGYQKFNSEVQTSALKELDWLDDMHAEYLTVTDPYLAEIVRTYSPKIKLKTSVIGELNSLSRALEWQDIIGPEGVLTLSIMINRNLPLLKEIRNAVKCDIELLASDCCLYDCPFRFFHYNECSHAGQIYDVLEGYYNDWATMACQNQKVFDPEQIIKCRWIQPADLEDYIAIGIDYFKISGRRFGTDWIYRSLKAYSDKAYDGDLGRVFDAYSFVVDPLETSGAQFSEFAVMQEKMGVDPDDLNTMMTVPIFNATLEGSKLKDFILNQPFQGARCTENCGISCNYCNEILKKAYTVPIDEATESYKNYMEFLYNYLNTHEMFVPKEERKLKSPFKKAKAHTFTGIPWDPEAQKFLEDIMLIILDEMKQAAKKGIGFTVERTAGQKGMSSVDKDLLILITIQVVPQPFKHDLLDFLEEKNIDLMHFMSNEDINYTKSLSYGTEIMAQKARSKGETIAESRSSNDLQQVQNPAENKINLDTKQEWESYLTSLLNIYNDLTELKPLLPPVAPLIFQYIITDKPEMNYWQFIDKMQVKWGMGEYSGPTAPKIIHKANFETIKKVYAGKADPIQETMAKRYAVEGDMTKLMACVPLLPLFGKAHAIVIQKGIEKKNILNTEEEWKSYLKAFIKAYNDLSELKPLLSPLAPLIFQYIVTDRPEMNYWLFIDNMQVKWGMGEYSGPSAPKIIHKANFETIKKVNAGEADPIQESMAKRYVVEGDMTKLMGCVPLLPLFSKAHVKAIQK